MGKTEFMWFKFGIVLLRKVYPMMRPFLKKAVDRPEEEWDNVLLGAVDGAMGYIKK